MIVFELQYFFKNNSCVYYIAKIFYQTVFETVKKPTFFLIDERTKPIYFLISTNLLFE